MLLAEIDYNQTTHDEGIDLIKQEKLTSITDIINNLVSLYKYLYNVTPYQINCGMCEDFDYDKDIGGTHYFVCYKGKYYDSECPEGVEDWKQLPAFMNNAALEKAAGWNL